MRFTVSIDCDTAAFDDGRGAEIARILRRVAGAVAENSPATLPLAVWILRDSNGNRVGSAGFADSEG